LSVPSSPPRRPPPVRNPPRRRSPSSFPPLIPFKPSLNGLNGYSPCRYSGHPPAPSPGPIKATPTTPGAPHTSPHPSPLLSHARNPPRRVSCGLFAPPPSPDRHAAARAPVRPSPSSPCAPLSVAPLPVSFGAPLFEDLPDQTFEESQLFFTDQQGKSP
jgi:hypothetical protein